MTVPHIHDENGLFIALEDTKDAAFPAKELKKIDIYQIFSGELALNHDVYHPPKKALISHNKAH
jgi:hypothetical protein